MKTRVIILTVICYLIVDSVSSQKVIFPLKFISFRHFRVSAGLGFEGSLDEKGHGGSLMYINRGNSNEIEMRNTDSFPYFSWKFILDLGSPNSILSFSTGLNYSDLSFALAQKGQSRFLDDYKIISMDVPSYIKLTFGSREQRSHIFLNLGGIYSIPISVKRKYSYLSVSGVDKNKNQITGNNWMPSAMFGLDLYMGSKSKTSNTYIDNWRMVLFAKMDYRIKALINSKYDYFLTTSNINYSNYEFKDFRLAIGLSMNFVLH